MEKIKESMVTINNVVFGNVHLNITEYGILKVFNSNGYWICGIDLEDIKDFTSNDSEINSEVNKFILEHISK